MQPLFDVIAIMFLPPFFFIIYGFRILERSDEKQKIQIPIAYKFPLQKSMKKDYLVITSVLSVCLLIVNFVEIPLIDKIETQEKSKIQNYNCLQLFNYKSHFSTVQDYRHFLLKKNCNALTILKNI